MSENGIQKVKNIQNRTRARLDRPENRRAVFECIKLQFPRFPWMFFVFVLLNSIYFHLKLKR